MVHSDFVHLHVHTQYSLLDGACHLDNLVDKAVSFKAPALAITDHGNLFGAIRFYKLCMSKGVKPIIGSEVYIAPDSRFKKEYKVGEDSFYHLIVLAKDEQGYKNLIRLVSLGNLEGFYYKPRIDKEILRQYSKGLLGLSACLKGEVSASLLAGEPNKARKLADDYLQIFGKGNFYLEFMDNGMPEQHRVNQELLKISKELGIPPVATNDVHYLEQHQSFAHEVLLCIQTQNMVDNPGRFKFSSNSFYFRSPQEMKEAFRDLPEAIHNTLEIMQKCNLIMDFSQIHLPHFPLPNEVNEEAFLRKICYDNIPVRYPKGGSEVTDRVEYELDVIRRTGFSSYFLIVWDLIKFAKESQVPVGPGRGSAAGSIVSYLLGITDIDPLRYNLLFERFLNPARISMPDIDIDFCYEKRSEILDYVCRRYGVENVAQIITFGTMLARAVIRDVGRVMGFTFSEVDRIAKMIPPSVGGHVGLKEALSTNPDLFELYNTDDRVKRLIDVAMQLEGLSRHASTHAAGVVISDKPLIERVPLIRGSDGETVTGFDMDSLEKTGLLKMDFLGLKTLTVIDGAIKIIKRTKGIDLDIGTLPLNDKKTFSLLTQGDTVGVFQLESRGMREILRKLRPSKFEDLIAVLALYRPGPLGSGMVDDFIQRKQGKKPITYLHPRVAPILKETYGIILYQEQTMQIASALAGFDLSQADLLRKAIGKKVPEIMEEQRNRFVEGCQEKHITSKIANQIFDLIDYFSGYGFNKSHSTAYALISYRTAYLKANFPTEFMAALLTSERTNTDKVVEYVNESSRMGIKVFPPEINTSFADFTVTDDGNIRFGLLAIKNVGKAALESIIQIRKEEKFASIFDFCERVDSRTVNKKVVESLVKSGAMDSFGLRRAQLVALLDKLLNRSGKKKDVNQMVLFAPTQEEQVPDIEEWPLSQILTFEKSLLGIYLTSHPLYTYEHLLKYISRTHIQSLSDEECVREVVVCGVLEKIRVITTRRTNARMAILKVEDETGSVEAFVFPRLFEEAQVLLRPKSVVILKGKLETKEKIPKILSEEIIPIERLLEKVKGVTISIGADKQALAQLKTIFAKSKGEVPVFFRFQDDRFKGIKLKTNQEFFLAPTEGALESISAVVGASNVSLRL